MRLKKDAFKRCISGLLSLLLVFVLALSSTMVIEANNYDVNPPVVTGVLSLAENGQVFTNDVQNSDKKVLHFTMGAYDAQGKIVSARIKANKIYDSENGHMVRGVEVYTDVSDPADGSNEVTFNINIGDLIVEGEESSDGIFVFSSISLIDESGNIKNYDCSNDNNVISINYDRVNLIGVEVEDTDIVINDKEKPIGTKLQLIFDKKLDNDCWFWVNFWSEEDYNFNAQTHTDSSNLELNEELSEEGNYVYETVDYFNKNNVAGKYSIDRQCNITYNGWHQRVEIPHTEITVTNNVFEEYDNDNIPYKNSQITSVEVDKEGEICTEDDLITFTVKTNTEEKWANKSEDACSVHLQSDVSDEIVDGYRCIHIPYVRTENGENIYQGQVKATELYPCEWYICHVNVEGTHDADKNIWYDVEGYDNNENPMYFMVNLQGSMKLKSYKKVNVTISDPVTGESKNYTSYNVNNHATIEELTSGEFKLPSSDSNMGKCIGITTGGDDNRLIDTDDINVGRLGYEEPDGEYGLNFELAYEKIRVTVAINDFEEYNNTGFYVCKPNFSYTSFKELYLSREYNEEELNDNLEKGKDLSSDIKFVKWTTSSYGSFIIVEPVYNVPYTSIILYDVMLKNGEMNGEVNDKCPYEITSLSGIVFAEPSDVEEFINGIDFGFPKEAEFKGWKKDDSFPDIVAFRAEYGKKYVTPYVSCYEENTYNNKKSYTNKFDKYGFFVDELTDENIVNKLNEKIVHPKGMEFTNWTIDSSLGLGFFVAQAHYNKYYESLDLTYINKDNEVVSKTVDGFYNKDTLHRDILNQASLDRRDDTVLVLSDGTNIPEYIQDQTIGQIGPYNGYSLYGMYENDVISSVTYPELRTVDKVNKKGQAYKYVPMKTVLLAMPKTVQTEEQLIKYMQDKGLIGTLEQYKRLRNDINGIKGEVRVMNSVFNIDTIYLTYKNVSPSVMDEDKPVKPDPKPPVEPVKPEPKPPVEPVKPDPKPAIEPIRPEQKPVVNITPQEETAPEPVVNPIPREEPNPQPSLEINPAVNPALAIEDTQSPVAVEQPAKVTQIQGTSVVTLDETKITEKVNEIQTAIQDAIYKAASTGSDVETPTVKVSMVNEDGSVATAVPKSILEAAKGQDVDVVLDMGGYSWKINGKDIKELKDVNLEVKLDDNKVPTKLIDKLAGGQPTRQLSLAFDGDFGFKADLSINLGSQYEGQYGNLYYYDSNGKLVFMNAGEIDKDGNVSLEFSHASDYVIVIGEDMTNSEYSSNVWWIVLIIVSVVVVGSVTGFVIYRKKNK